MKVAAPHHAHRRPSSHRAAPSTAASQPEPYPGRQARLRLALALALAPILGGAAPVETTKGLVASADARASAAGAAVLRAGGNALDALIATAYALSVVEPFSAGIGGGGFLLYRDAKSGKVHALDYREIAPKKAHRDLFLVEGKVEPRLSRETMLGVGVPSMVVGLAEAQAKLGKKKLADVLDGAIDLADNGFRAGPRYHAASRRALELLRKNPAAAETFLTPEGEPVPVGAEVRQRALAKVLRDLKKDGPALFQTGWVAQAIAKESGRLGGVLELDDLRSYKPKWREPLTGSYRGHELFFMPPPSSGGVHILQVLAMLEEDKKKRGRGDEWPPRPGDVHVLIEALRRAFADRAQHLGDPDFVKVPLDRLLDPTYLSRRYRSIDPKHATKSADVAGGGFSAEPNDTTHITVVDAEGNVAAATQSVNYGFGSGIVVPKTGILLNNELDDFAAAPGVPNLYGLVGGEANAVAPGKVPLSSMTPTIVVKDGKVRWALGAPGGSTIITTVLQTLIRLIDYGLDLNQAVSLPRLHHQWLPDVTELEAGALPPSVIGDLERRGHQLKHGGTWGNATAIEIAPDGTRIGVSDPRGDGAPVAE